MLWMLGIGEVRKHAHLVMEVSKILLREYGKLPPDKISEAIERDYGHHNNKRFEKGHGIQFHNLPDFWFYLLEHSPPISRIPKCSHLVLSVGGLGGQKYPGFSLNTNDGGNSWTADSGYKENLRTQSLIRVLEKKYKVRNFDREVGKM